MNAIAAAAADECAERKGARDGDEDAESRAVSIDAHLIKGKWRRAAVEVVVGEEEEMRAEVEYLQRWTSSRKAMTAAVAAMAERLTKEQQKEGREGRSL